MIGQAAVRTEGNLQRAGSLQALNQPQGHLAPFLKSACFTLQRSIGLQALVTGGLPTFFDISRSFSAGALQEDSLLHQLQLQHKRMVRPALCQWPQHRSRAYYFVPSEIQAQRRATQCMLW